jgi:hypothetical protein
MTIFLMSFAFAGITLSETEEIYNLGDRIYVSAEGLRGSETGNLNVDLLCGNIAVNLEKMSARRYSSSEEFPYSLPYKILDEKDLEIQNLTSIIGDCQVRMTLSGQFAISRTFVISDEIRVAASADKTNYDPGEGILIDIEAVKANGVLLDGFIEATNASSFGKAIADGSTSETFSLDDNAEAGSYTLNIRAYDSGSNGALNEGFTSITFNINQITSAVILSLSGEEAIPGENFTIGSELFDQSGKEISGTVPIQLISPAKEELEVLIPSGEFETFDFPINASAGTWKAIASFDGITEERDFVMREFSKMEFNITSGVLEVTCIGNSDCNGTVEIKIGEEIKKMDLRMDLNEVRKFSLKAPTGEYEVVVGNGENTVSRQVLLTGNAISVKGLREVGIFKAYSIVWIFLIIVLAGIGFVLFMRYGKTKTVKEQGKTSKIVNKIKGKLGLIRSDVDKRVPKKIKSHVDSTLNFTTKSPKVQGLDQENYSHEDKSMMDMTKSKISGAESSLVLKGEKHISSVVALSVKNYSSLKENGKNSLTKIITDAKGDKGLIDWKSDYIFIVFSPLVTKTYSNELLAVKAGKKILGDLNDYNKKFKDKIQFNIGIHSGELISSKTNGKLKYTSIGNTISLAKRISDSDNGKLIVSADIRKKMMRDLRVVKGKEVGKSQTFEVSEIRDREANNAKLKDLLKRMD